MYINRGIYKMEKRKKYNFKWELIYWLLFIIAMTFKSIYFSYLYGFNGYSLIPIILSSIGMAAFSILISNRKRYYMALIINLLFTIILISDLVYSRYYGNPLTFSLLYQLSLVGDTFESVTYLINYKDSFLAVDFLVLLIYFIVMGKKYGTRAKRIYGKLKIISAAFLIACLFISYRFFISYDKHMVENFSINRSIRHAGIYNFHLSDMTSYIKNRFYKESLTPEETETLLSRFEKTPGENEYTAAASGMNLLIIQLEAIQGFVINSKINGREITPNLNRLIDKSLYFNNLYYQVSGGNTSDAEFLTNTSLYPAEKGAAYFIYPDNKFYSLSKLMKSAGYKSYVFHANDPSFWNRSAMYKSLGFDRFISENDLELSEILGWGLSDPELYQQAVKFLDGNEPFHAFIISLSSHYPYFEFNEYDFDVGKYEGTILGNYLRAAHYADSAVGSLYRQLNESGMLENTVLAIYGDHFGISMQNADLITEFKGVKDIIPERIKLQKVPFIIHSPSHNNLKGIIQTTGGQIDIMPTLANIMGIDCSPYALGTDILSSESGYALLRDGTTITDSFIYYGKNNSVYNVKTNEELNIKDFRDTIAKIQKELSISDLILNKDALRKLDIP